MGSIGPTELLILLVVVVAVALVAIRGRISANHSRQTGRKHPGRGIAAPSVAPPVVADAAPPLGSIEARLLELDSLRSRGVINADEYASARIRALEGRAGS
jgi:hypothetical protein